LYAKTKLNQTFIVIGYSRVDGQCNSLVQHCIVMVPTLRVHPFLPLLRENKNNPIKQLDRRFSG